jgi:hypothetical protein
MICNKKSYIYMQSKLHAFQKIIYIYVLNMNCYEILTCMHILNSKNFNKNFQFLFELINANY